MKLLPAEFSVNWTMPNFSEKYARFYPSWAWIGETVNGKAKQLFRWTTCREIFTANLKRDIVGKYNNICADRTRFALKSSYSKTVKTLNHESIFKSSDRAMITAMKILNVIEKEAGWELTTITKLKRNTIKNVNGEAIIINTYFIDGPKEWMKSTPFVSLYTLIIRSGWFREFSKVKQVGDIAPICKKIIDRKCPITKVQQHLRLIDESYEYWMLLVLNQKRLFGSRKPITIYSKNNEHSGVAKLISFSQAIDKTTLKCWKKLVKKSPEM